MKRIVQNITSGAKNVVGKNMEEARIHSGYTQKQLSEKLEMLGLCICRDSICRIERGTRQVTDFEALLIGHVLGIDMNQMFQGALSKLLDTGRG